MHTDQQPYGEMVAADQKAALDDILSRWHHWSQGYRAARGYNNRSLVMGDYKVSRQYDDANGALDSDIENTIMEDVEFQVLQMVDPYRSAIYMLGRGLSLGLAVFRHPRVPEGEAGRHVVLIARNTLTARLISAGVM